MSDDREQAQTPHGLLWAIVAVGLISIHPLLGTDVLIPSLVGAAALALFLAVLSVRGSYAIDK